MANATTMAAEGEPRQGRENHTLSRLGQLRREAQLAKDVAKAATGGPAAKAKLALSFGKKVSEHWLILATAVLFDFTLGLIPFVNIVFNAIFGMILFLYFGPKSKPGSGFFQSEFVKIVLPMGGLSIFDFFLDVLPACTGATLIRIALS